VKIFTGYLLREFFRMFGLCLASFIILWELIDVFVEKADRMFGEYGTVELVTQYLLFSIPPILYYMIPATVLLATLLTLSLMSKNNEILALRAGGVNLYRLLIPLLTIGAIMSVLLFFLNEKINPYCQTKSKEIWDYQLKGEQRKMLDKRENLWSYDGNKFFRAELFVPERFLMTGLELIEVDESFKLRRKTTAQRAYWDGKRWVAVGLQEIAFNTDGSVDYLTKNADILDAGVYFGDLSDIQLTTEEMNRDQLGRYIKKLRREGFDTTPYLVDYHLKLAFPLVAIIMVLAGFPFAIRSGRFGGVATGIFFGFVVGVSYWVLMGTMQSIGHSGTIPPLVAAWFPNIFFIVLSFFLMRRITR
jgi:lipopolysaccharide export system permease protein